MNQEIWKTIFRFNNYEISNFGNIKKNGKKYIPKISNKGYLRVSLTNKNVSETIQVHRLVALHFIPNPGMLPQVNHIDGDKTNNRVDNLEWCDNEYNQKHAIKMGLANPHNERSVVCIKKDGTEIVFKSAAEAGRALNINPGSINSVCTGHNKYRHTAGGYRWKYK